MSKLLYLSFLTHFLRMLLFLLLRRIFCYNSLIGLPSIQMLPVSATSTGWSMVHASRSWASCLPPFCPISRNTFSPFLKALQQSKISLSEPTVFRLCASFSRSSRREWHRMTCTPPLNSLPTRTTLSGHPSRSSNFSWATKLTRPCNSWS